VPIVALADLLDVASSPLAHETLGVATGGGWVVTDLHEERHHHVGADDLAHLGCVLVAIGAPRHPCAHAFDVVVADGAGAAAVTNAVDAHPVAATALALLLRGGERRTVAEGLVAESATYSALQSGAEHRAWLETRSPRERSAATEPPVLLTRRGNSLRITLNRPAVRNAYNAETRDALLDALAIASSDPSVTDVVIDGAGSAFCSGGDLDEFGSLADPASAHLLRLARSVAHAMDLLRDRTTVRVHGACVGAGVELPAFAGRVVAREDATFRLPEVAMGLVPGAGGTVIIPRRIGRQGAACLAITDARVDASTALAWGLVDEVTPQTPGRR
jgi:enoyl-CoA hydratase/carnithine racemase